MRTACAGCCLMALLLCTGAHSNDEPSDKKSDLAAKSLSALTEAINARDATKVAKLFVPSGEFVDGEGNVFQGRESIAKEFAALFEVNPRSSIQLAAEHVREISPGLLTIDGVVTVTASEKAEPEEVDFTALVVRQQDDRWLLASIRSLGEVDDGSPHSQLKQLAWLIGEWVDESDASTMHTITRWSEDGNFLLTDFSVHVAGHKAKAGSQRIGWDGSINKFKSWVFDSDGGHAEGIWTGRDGHWIVEAKGVRSDGEACTATNIYEPVGTDAYLFSVTNRIDGGEQQPDFTAHVVRKPPEPQKAATAAPVRRK